MPFNIKLSAGVRKKSLTNDLINRLSFFSPRLLSRSTKWNTQKKKGKKEQANSEEN